MKRIVLQIAGCFSIAALLLASSANAQSPQGEEVELFAAMEAGDLEVKFIPRDAKQANVLIKNNTKKPLKIKLPDAFAGVPVLAQFGGNQGGFGGGGGGFGGGNQQNQAMGGGMMGGGMMGGGMMGGGFMNVAPDKVGKVKVAAVCLEHGKDDPNPRIPYQIVPITQFTDNQQAIEVCKMLGRGEIDQASAQAAAWHFTDGLTWQELVTKIGVEHLNGTVEPFFSQVQVARAMRIAQVAAYRAQQSAQEPIPGKENSLSQN